ncbi:MAG: glycerol-3-phosphate dehydrogenase/oxidase [Myxococcota bacterium]
MATPQPVGRSSDLDFRDRPRLFAHAEARTFDVVVVGAGITGAGVARSAAARGLTVALVEARDISSGTSSRSSKLIHGGIRYLAEGAFSLVRETARERQILRSIAPHLTRKASMVLPTRSFAEKAKYRAGVALFEKLGNVPREERHRMLNRNELAEIEPVAATPGATGGVQYYEFVTDDARLTLANVRSAVSDGAVVLTYAPVVEILEEGGRAVGVRCRSRLPGESLEAIIRGRVIVNAAGPWVDALRAFESPSNDARLTLTKGIHLVVPRGRLPIENVVVFEAADRRPVFAIPRDGVTYLGTTDTFHPEAEYWPAITQEEVDYLFAAASRTFTAEPLEPDDVVSSWTGVRPLVAQPGKRPSEISRRDEIWTGPTGVLSIAGGKLTAYRAMAERVVDAACRTLDHGADEGDGAHEPLVGGDCDPTALLAERHPGSSAWRRLVDLYGSEAADLDDAGGDVRAEVRHAVLREGALRLEDYWVRRSVRALFDPDAGLSTLQTAAIEMTALLGWSSARREEEVDGCLARFAHDNALFARAASQARAEPQKGTSHELQHG